MSEANNAWQIDGDGVSHQLEVHHNALTGKIVVTLDGSELEEDRLLFREKHVEVDIDGHKAVVEISYKYGGLATGSELHLDGKFVEPLAR